MGQRMSHLVFSQYQVNQRIPTSHVLIGLHAKLRMHFLNIRGHFLILYRKQVIENTECFSLKVQDMDLPLSMGECLRMGEQTSCLHMNFSSHNFNQKMLLDPLASLKLSQEVIAANCLVKVTKIKAYLKVFNPRQNDVM